MGKIILANNEIKKIYLAGNDVKKVYLGGNEVWSASNLPDWIAQSSALLSLLDTLPKYSNYYADFAYQYTNNLYDCTYYRVFSDVDGPFNLERVSNYYSVMQNPYVSSYTGFTVISLNLRKSDNSWYHVGTTTRQDRGKTEFSNNTFQHRAIIQSTLQELVNRTGAAFEDYR